MTLILSLLLALIGLGFWLGTGREHVTALIPAFLAVPLGLVGWWASRDPERRLPRQLAVGLVVVALAGTARGLVGAFRLAGGAEVARPDAQVAQAAVALLCLAWLVAAFVMRRRPAAAGS